MTGKTLVILFLSMFSVTVALCSYMDLSTKQKQVDEAQKRAELADADFAKAMQIALGGQ